MGEREFKQLTTDDQLHALYAATHVNKRMLREILAHFGKNASDGDGKAQATDTGKKVFVSESTFKKRLANLTKKWTRDHLKKSVEDFYKESDKAGSKKGGIVAMAVPATYATLQGDLREDERYSIDEYAMTKAISARLHNRRSRVKPELAEFIAQMSGKSGSRLCPCYCLSVCVSPTTNVICMHVGLRKDLTCGNCTHDGKTLPENNPDLALQPGTSKFMDVFRSIAFADMNAFTELKALDFSRSDFDIFHESVSAEFAQSPKCSRLWLEGPTCITVRELVLFNA
jgi:hypothetical protein